MESVQLNQSVSAVVVAAGGEVCQSWACIVVIFDRLLVCCICSFQPSVIPKTLTVCASPQTPFSCGSARDDNHGRAAPEGRGSRGIPQPVSGSRSRRRNRGGRHRYGGGAVWRRPVRESADGLEDCDRDRIGGVDTPAVHRGLSRKLHDLAGHGLVAGARLQHILSECVGATVCCDAAGVKGSVRELRVRSLSWYAGTSKIVSANEAPF